MASTVGCDTATINIYDSLHLSLTPELEEVVSDLLHTKRKHITINYMNVQVQKGSSDCGPLAIAFATAICHGQNPECITYNQHGMRTHLFEAYEKSLLTPFPSRPATRKAVLKKQKINIYCSCRQTENGRSMVCCDGCQEWYHRDCIKITTGAWKSKKMQWFCDTCRN